MVKIPKIDYVAYLVNRKFPDFMPPFPIGLQFKQYDGIIHSDEDEWLPPSIEIVEKAKIYREKLSGFPKPGLKKLYQAELIKQYEDDDQKRFFNLPDAAADYEYWSKMAHWTLDEALALSFGKNPKVVTWKRLEKIMSYTSPFVRKYERTRELALRAVTWKKLYDPVLPTIFINWVKENEILFPDELAVIIQAKNSDLTDWKKNYDELLEKSNQTVASANQIIDAKNQKIQELESSEIAGKPLHTKERETLLKLIIGMATDGYGYDPNAARSPIPREIAEALTSKGISLDQDTVRGWLKKASDLLPSDNESPES